MGMYGPRGDRKASFEKFIKPDASGCWIWTGSGSGKAAGNHGNFWYEGRMQRAHRVAWRLFRGEIPEGLNVCHRCDVPRCVNPEHLFLGTQQDNIADMVVKGRQQRVPRPGESNTQAKITEDDVRAIRAKAEAGETHTNIGREFGLSFAQIRRIVRRERWANVP